jgi:hypothetical protein
LVRALERLVLPELPERPAVESYLAELKSAVAVTKPRPLPYPHIRVAHVGGLAMFGMVATHYDLAAIDFEAELSIGFDMLLIEPDVDDPLDGLDSERLDRFTEAGIPVLLVARTTDHLNHGWVDRVDLILTEDPDLAEQAKEKELEVLLLHPSVDDTIHNPIGWKQHPQHRLMVIADHPGITSDLDTLLPVAHQLNLYGSAIPGLEPLRHTPDRPTGKTLTDEAKNHLAVYATPQLAATPVSHIQTVLNLTAAGIPVITPPDPTLTQLIPNHLTATNPQQLAGHLETLEHPPTRERQSIPNRRHILTHHTRKHRFEQILTHHDIPTNPTPKISILLATKRPDHIEHALNSVTTQNWDNKELILILHGDNFDLPHIQTLTNQLPYPTHIITCPEKTIFGDALNQGLHKATGQYITKMDDDDHYGPNHLTDLHTAHTYTNADIVGKLASIVHLSEFDLTVSREIMDAERFHHHVAGPTLLAPAAVVKSYNFLRRPSRVDTTLLERVTDSGGSLYITHPYGFILERRTSGHTWEVGGYKHFVKNARELDEGVDGVFLEVG